MDCKEEIRAYIRIRPLNQREKKSKTITYTGSTCHVKINDQKKSVSQQINPNLERSYAFERVFEPDDPQEEVYRSAVQPAINEVLAGYNCTIFAYGESGSGKTYTMVGKDIGIASSENIHAGLIPRSITDLFTQLNEKYQEYEVRVSYVELYNEVIYDLLRDEGDIKQIKLFDDPLKKGAVIMTGTNVFLVKNEEEVFRLLVLGTSRKQIGETRLNIESSRSHTIFTMTVNMTVQTEHETFLRTGKLYLVDLAGSENCKNETVSERRRRESTNINLSLLTLARCIQALANNNTHIPYRESKLTRILQDSLGGNAKTRMIATLSLSHSMESHSTLRYASTIRNISNKPYINDALVKDSFAKKSVDIIDKILSTFEEYISFDVECSSPDEIISHIERVKEQIDIMNNELEPLAVDVQIKKELRTNCQIDLTSIQQLNIVLSVLQYLKSTHLMLLEELALNEQTLKITQSLESELDYSSGKRSTELNEANFTNYAEDILTRVSEVSEMNSIISTMEFTLREQHEANEAFLSDMTVFIDKLVSKVELKKNEYNSSVLEIEGVAERNSAVDLDDVTKDLLKKTDITEACHRFSRNSKCILEEFEEVKRNMINPRLKMLEKIKSLMIEVESLRNQMKIDLEKLLMKLSILKDMIKIIEPGRESVDKENAVIFSNLQMLFSTLSEEIEKTKMKNAHDLQKGINHLESISLQCLDVKDGTDVSKAFQRCSLNNLDSEAKHLLDPDEQTLRSISEVFKSWEAVTDEMQDEIIQRVEDGEILAAKELEKNHALKQTVEKLVDTYFQKKLTIEKSDDHLETEIIHQHHVNSLNEATKTINDGFDQLDVFVQIGRDRVAQ